MTTLKPTCSELPDRCRETLELLKRGHSEKQAAIALGISPHTLHVHVKRLYRILNVNSRSELLARFIED